MTAPNTMPPVTKLATSKQPPESWDDDFGDDDIDPSAFRSSVSSIGSAASSTRPNLAVDDIDGFEDDDDLKDFDTLSLSRAPPRNPSVGTISMLGARKSSVEVGSGRKQSVDGSSTLSGLDDSHDHDDTLLANSFGQKYNTITAGQMATLSSKPSMSFYDGGTLRKQGVRNGSVNSRPISDHPFPNPPAPENFEDDFAFEDELDGAKLSLSHVQPKLGLNSAKMAIHEDDLESWGEESLGVRPGSRLSEMSSSASAYSSTVEDSEADEEAFLDGVQLPEHALNLNALERRRKEALLIAEREDEQLMQGRKYDTIRSNGSGNSIKNKDSALSMLQGEDDDGDDFLDGIELKDNSGIVPTSEAHRHVVVKSSMRTRLSPSRSSNSVQFANQINHPPRVSQSSANLRSVSQAKRVPSRIPSLSQQQRNTILRSKQSMPALRAPSGTSGGVHNDLQRSPPKQLPQNQPMTLRRPSSNAVLDSHISLSKGREAPGSGAAGLRTVQSMAVIPKSKPALEARQKFSRARTGGRQYGDGSELDLLDDIPTSIDQERSYTVNARPKTTVVRKPLDTYRERQAPTKSTKRREHGPAEFVKQKSVHVRRKRVDKTRKGPGLIQQLGPPVAAISGKGHNGEMRFNPRKLIWEGNDVELKKFDSLKVKAPGLIAFISNKGVQVVGDMVFDPQKLRWVNVNENKDDDDPFLGVEDLEVSSNPEPARGNFGGRGGGSLTSSVASHGGEIQVGDEFEISQEFARKLDHEYHRWTRKVNGWYSVDESRDTAYLNEIRNMVMGNR